ncbi:MAG: alpha-galactosidase [Lachnospiraceae bacterium]|nr:alpha-galactosidase [Lachnospiraceae bacterium]
MKRAYSEFILGDMKACYVQDEETGSMELVLLPADTAYEVAYREKPYPDSLVQVKLVGDTYAGGYAGGRTMRQNASVAALVFESQEKRQDNGETVICTTLADARGYRYRHFLRWKEGKKSLLSHTEFENVSKEKVGLELLSSFSLGGISPFVRADETGKLKLHRIRSVWSMEGREESQLLEDLQLEPSWGGHAVRCERFGQVGSMPVNGYFPYAVMEDVKSDLFWGAMICHNASWQMEVYRRGDDVNLSGGLADYDFGHWMKEIAPSETFVTPTAILSVCRGGGIDEISQRMTSAVDDAVNQGPVSEQELPIIFNEYCTTWGCPSHENICGILNAIKDKGFSYFVIDCGWYKQEGVPWDVAMGDYRVSKELFPEGLDKTVDAIKAHGMKPGIWFEIDNVGEKAESYQMTEHLLTRNGAPLTTSMRRFWDMRQDWVQDYLEERVIGTLEKYGFSYMKMDYNDTIGVGCDGAESLGEGLRQNMEASLSFIRKVKERIPGFILENCSSGGHKLEPLMMSECSMASFSDAHECEEIPIIAAALHRVILPRQSQIWAVIREQDSLKRIAYSIANTFLGRMCLSGDVTKLTAQQWDVIDRGIAFYKKAAPIIKNGCSRLYGPKVESWRHPKGWQCLLRTEGSVEHEKKDGLLAVFHSFNGAHEGALEVPLPADGTYRIEEVYSDAETDVRVEDGKLVCRISEDMRAVAVLGRKI